MKTCTLIIRLIGLHLLVSNAFALHALLVVRAGFAETEKAQREMYFSAVAPFQFRPNQISKSQAEISKKQVNEFESLTTVQLFRIVSAMVVGLGATVYAGRIATLLTFDSEERGRHLNFS
jgi:hypothetical protein